MNKVIVLLALIICASCTKQNSFPDLVASLNDLHFDQLPQSWDEAIPLGNGMLGVLVWEKEGKLRLSLDRADLWDLRPMSNLDIPEWRFEWVYEQWKNDTYGIVQDMYDKTYESDPAPSKIPGAALEFDISSLGKVKSVHLYVDKAICEIKWENGERLLTFVHATDAIGWYKFEGLKEDLSFELIPPAYNLTKTSEKDNAVSGPDLRRLEYAEGKITKDENTIIYDQKGWDKFSYQVSITGDSDDKLAQGCWSISSQFVEQETQIKANKSTIENYVKGFEEAFKTHEGWWKNFWSKSSLQVPDTILEKQWYLEQYKFGSSARVGAPPISLQAVWTADNGRLPPWKGDFHHDLNTQLSYWPAYSGNHLDEEIGFIDWLWKNKDTFKKYTKGYFGTNGINVPGVSTLTGQPMGGWIQYAFGPTVSAWLAHHFYLHWRYSMDREFLEQRAYPWLKDVAIFLDEISEMDEMGNRKLPISSTPEVNNNAREAWFSETTNYDLALIKWTYEKAAELAAELGKEEEEKKWKEILAQWPDLIIDEKSGFMFATDLTYAESHRHFSHLMAFHPLGIVDFSKGKEDEKIIMNTLNTLERVGPDFWTGYSYSWLANLKARAFDGEGAAEALRIFATKFCSPNSFHLNGDQSGEGYSTFKYRPFTLEGNFAFASGLQEMLIQSHTGTIVIFPAIPNDWEDASFNQLRTEGAFLISAKKENNQLHYVQVLAEKGGILKLKNPFGSIEFVCSVDYEINEFNEIIIVTNEGDDIVFELK